MNTSGWPALKAYALWNSQGYEDIMCRYQERFCFTMDYCKLQIKLLGRHLCGLGA